MPPLATPRPQTHPHMQMHASHLTVLRRSLKSPRVLPDVHSRVLSSPECGPASLTPFSAVNCGRSDGRHFKIRPRKDRLGRLLLSCLPALGRPPACVGCPVEQPTRQGTKPPVQPPRGSRALPTARSEREAGPSSASWTEDLESAGPHPGGHWPTDMNVCSFMRLNFEIITSTIFLSVYSVC